MDYVAILTNHIPFPLVAFFIILAILIIGIGFISGWFRRCSKCGSRLTIVGAYEGGINESSEIRAIRDCLCCGHQESMPLPKLPHYPGP